MEITYLGHSSFKIKTKNATVVNDPFDPSKVGLKFPKLEADIVTVSHAHQDHNFLEGIVGSPFVTPGPGEYEVRGVSITGIKTYHDDKKGSRRGENTVYIIADEDLRVCHLGDLGHKLDESLLGQIGSIDILLVPVGGFYTIGPSEAAEIVNQIEPFIVIPMHFQTQGMSATFSSLLKVEDFLGQIGKEARREQKLSVKRADLSEAEVEVVILERKV